MHVSADSVPGSKGARESGQLWKDTAAAASWELLSGAVVWLANVNFVMSIPKSTGRAKLRGSDASRCLARLFVSAAHAHAYAQAACRRVLRDSKSLGTTLQVASCRNRSRSWSYVGHFLQLLIDVEQGATPLPAGAD